MNCAVPVVTSSPPSAVCPVTTSPLASVGKIPSVTPPSILFADELPNPILFVASKNPVCAGSVPAVPPIADVKVNQNAIIFGNIIFFCAYFC